MEIVRIINLIWIISLFFVTSCSYSRAREMEYKPKLKFNYSKADYLNYEVIGNGQIPLIFLHGFGSSLRNWDDVIAHLPQDIFTSYLIDLKGSGFSSKPKDAKYSIDDQASLISAFIKKNDLREYTLIGHSFGGGVSLFVALKLLNDKQLMPKKLILIDTAAYNTDLPFFVDNIRIPLINHIILNLTSSEFRAKHTLNRIIYHKNKITPELIGRYAYFMNLENYNYALIKTAKNIIPKDLNTYTSRYPNIDVPTLIIWGKNDPALPLSLGEQLLEELPYAKLHILNECGHNPHEEYPEEVANLIVLFTKSKHGE